MTLTPEIAKYWESYLVKHPEAADKFDSAWAFGDNPRLADEICWIWFLEESRPGPRKIMS